MAPTRQEFCDLAADLDRAIQEISVWREKDELLHTVPGVGAKVSVTPLTELPELGTLGNMKLAELVGVAPLKGDSGVFRGEGGGPTNAVHGRGDSRPVQPRL